MAAYPAGLPASFDQAMRSLGPFEMRPALAVAVSGGADSMALALLARHWVHQNDGTLTAFIVDHGLRSESATEATVTAERLGRLGIAARIMPLTDLPRGSALAERARIERYRALTQACAAADCLHLLLGHHAGDQAETLAMRVLRGSRTDGLAAMAAVWETPSLRLLRPLLGFDPAALRRYLTDQGVVWVEDPSNRDRRALRSRLRQHLMPASSALLSRACMTAGRQRALGEAAVATVLARHTTIRPEGFALLGRQRLTEAALSSLIRTIGGAAYPPEPDRIADLASNPRPMTLAGVRICQAGRLAANGSDQALLIIREEAAIQQPVPASAETIWDGRFRIIIMGALPDGATISKLGQDAARFRAVSDLPAAVLRTLPALRSGKILAAVPHLRYVSNEHDMAMTVIFSPRSPAAGTCFHPTNHFRPDEGSPQ